METEFREKETQALADRLRQHQSVVLIGMKRVGITGFLRNFVAQKKRPGQFFVYLDLNDLVERELLPFWTLLLTRLVDNIQIGGFPEKDKRQARHLFIQSIQLKDHFFTLEAIRKILEKVKLQTVIFINRFDRLLKAITLEFLTNLAGLHTPCVFTSFREITRLNQALFCHNLYFKPAFEKDATHPKSLLALCGGYSQYLQLAAIALNHNGKADLFADEAINFQSEELWASLTMAEKHALLTKNYSAAPYLTQTGMINAKNQLFSPLFAAYLKSLPKKPNRQTELTEKETRLFQLLKKHLNQVCDRDQIIDAVWPETKEAGITDWAIERLISRVRSKLLAHHLKFSIVTVHTRGYKLVLVNQP